MFDLTITQKTEKKVGKVWKIKKIKEWYLKEYSTDSVGNDLLDNITFYDLFYALDRRKDIYITLFGSEDLGDSLVRERIFEKLAEIMGVDYNYIYEQWLLCE